MIAILLATYNGEKFLREQIDSLLNQTEQGFSIYIHDDGSTDGTLDIIDSYVAENPGRFIVLEDVIKHRGAMDSFMWMLGNVEADYYMFCDQDDVWDRTKIQLSLNKVHELESDDMSLPVMVHTDLKVVDKELNVLHESFWKMNGFDVDVHRKFNFACAGTNVFTGCTMMMNRKCKDYVFPVSKHASMHDQWIGLVVSKYGRVDNVKQPTVLYRQHGGNVCSAWANKKSGSQSYWEYCRHMRPLLDDLNYGYTLKFIFFNRLYKIIKRFHNRNR